MDEPGVSEASGHQKRSLWIKVKADQCGENFDLTLPVMYVSWVSVTLQLMCCQCRFKGKIFLKAVTNMSNFAIQKPLLYS